MFSNQQFFRQLIETFVTEDWVKEIDFDSCQKVDKEFISAHYKETESDIIYQVKFRDKTAYIYRLIKMAMSKDEMNGNTDFIDSIIRRYSEKQDYSSIKNISLDIELGEIKYNLIRLRDEQYYLLGKNSLAIEDRYSCLTRSTRYNNSIYSNFAKVYITLKMLFGESGDCYDNWKGAFAFPFLIYFQKGEEEFCYLMNICNARSSIEFRIRKLIKVYDNDFSRGVYHDPFPDFSTEEIASFINYFVNFCTGFFESMSGSYNEPFFKKISSEHILFGYKDGEFFEEYYLDEVLDEAKNKA